MQTRRQFMQAALALAAAAQATARGEEGAVTLTAGAGRVDVRFPAGLFPLEGFAGQHDALAARVLLVESGGVRIAIAGIDITSMPAALVAACKAMIGEVAAVPAERVLVCASHTFSAPHVTAEGNDAVSQCYATALRLAAAQAVAALQPATIGSHGETMRGLCERADGRMVFQLRSYKKDD